MITKAQIQAMNPEMAAMWIHGHGPRLSKAQYHALVIACRNGGYVEAGTGAHRGHIERVSASALNALIRRGHLEGCFGSEGGMAGQLTEKARLKLHEVITATPDYSSDQKAANET